MADKPPPSLKAVQPFLVVAKQFETRDPVVAYYARMYVVQEGIKLSKNDPTAKGYLIHIMDQLDHTKKALKDEEAMQSEVVAQAHIEETALKLFDFADTEDRAARFHKNMIRAFFTCGQIFTTLKQFGELSEEIETKLKYAKWKAVEIDRCLKSGITPTPGPPGGEEDELGFGQPAIGEPSEPSWIPPGAQQVLPPVPKPVPKPRQNIPPQEDPGYPPQQPGYSPQQPGYPPQQPGYPPQQPGYPPQQPGYPPQQQGYPPQQPSYPPQQPSYPPQQPQVPEPTPNSDPTSSSGGFSYQAPAAPSLGPADIAKAQKLCKFAGSALEYDDVPGAVEFLNKALKLLTTGK